MSDSNWIKISDRQPVFPAWLWHPEADVPTLKQSGADYAGFGYTHWQPTNLQPPAPPPKEELTQREKDEEAYRHWVNTLVTYVDHLHVWHAALTREREQLLQELAPLRRSQVGHPGRFLDWDEVKSLLKARREGGAK